MSPEMYLLLMTQIVGAVSAIAAYFRARANSSQVRQVDGKVDDAKTAAVVVKSTLDATNGSVSSALGNLSTDVQTLSQIVATMQSMAHDHPIVAAGTVDSIVKPATA